MQLVEDTPPRPATPWLLAGWAVRVAVVLGVLVGIRTLVAWSGVSPMLWMVVLGAAIAPVVLGRYFWLYVVTPLTTGRRCPACVDGQLIFVRAISFGNRYYCCGDCGRRFKRTSPEEPWQEADGVRDLPFFQPKPKTALPTSEEWAWAGIFLGSLLAWPALVALGYGIAGMGGSVAGTLVGLPLIEAMHRGLARMKEAAHRMRHQDAVDGLA